jgi:hypothetical protein
MHKPSQRLTFLLPEDVLDSLKLPFWECRLKLGEASLEMLKAQLSK